MTIAACTMLYSRDLTQAGYFERRARSSIYYLQYTRPGKNYGIIKLSLKK